MMMAAINAIPKPSILNESPINSAVNDNNAALMTIKNNPSEKIVTGNVNKTKMGFRKTLNSDNNTLAESAAVIFSI